MEAAREISAEQVAELERRIQALEARTLSEPVSQRREASLVERYGESVDKTSAAKLLGVTRSTVYTMLSDGRILGACGGRRVDVRSIARYLSQPAHSAPVN